MPEPQVHYELVVIGAGPAGHKAAIQASKAGHSVLLVDRSAAPGGECVQRGTIPSKTLRESALYLAGLKQRAAGIVSSELDAHTKVDVRAELQQLLSGLGLPVLLVTHDFEDAAALADCVGVIVDGALRQTGTPTELVAHPRDPFVAAFTGANLLRGRGESVGATTWVRLDDGSVVATTEPARGDVVLAVYPWDIVVSTVPPNDSALNLIAAPIGSIAELGNRARVTIGPVSAEITAESLHRLGLRVGQTAFASFKATGTRVVANGGERTP